jgi:signal transduction histidine kinase
MHTFLHNIGDKIVEKLRVLRYTFEQSSFGRLSNRLLFNLIMLFAVPLILVVFFMRSVTQDSITEIIKNQNILISRRAANEIKLFLKIPNTLLKILLDTKELKEMNPLTQKIILDRVITQYRPIFHRIFTIDTTGLEISTSDSGRPNTRYVNENFFLSAVGKDTSYISPLKFNNMKEPFVISSHSIKQSNHIVGVLAGEINLMGIWDLVDEITIGETGNAFVIDGSGKLIAHSDKDKVIDKLSVIDTSIIKDIKDVSEICQVFISADGVSLMGTFVYLEEYDWIIAIQQPVDEAFAVASTMLYEVLAFVVLVILIAIILATLLEKRITEPIKSLIRGVKRYAEGDLDFRIHIERYEEIALLAEEFNSMARSLHENQRKLRRVERLAAMSKFATLVSHEIRNPLNSMNINMQILKREIENPAGNAKKKQKYLNIISSEINRMENLIKNFLMIARPPRFDFVLNDMHGILEEVILLHGENSKQQNICIKKEFQDEKTITNVDRDQMKQVFHNIIINALQAMPGGGELKIQTSLKKMGNSLDQNVQFIRIKFIDTGIGIPEDKINDIFEVYYTMKKTGTGLGLAIARQIVEGHFGAIDVKSTLGEGTTVTVSIPANSGLDTL